MFVGRIYFHYFSELKIYMEITFLNPLFHIYFCNVDIAADLFCAEKYQVPHP